MTIATIIGSVPLVSYGLQRDNWLQVTCPRVNLTQCFQVSTERGTTQNRTRNLSHRHVSERRIKAIWYKLSR